MANGPSSETTKIRAAPRSRDDGLSRRIAADKGPNRTTGQTRAATRYPQDDCAQAQYGVLPESQPKSIAEQRLNSSIFQFEMLGDKVFRIGNQKIVNRADVMLLSSEGHLSDWERLLVQDREYVAGSRLSYRRGM